jgi:hypothetical protein
MPNSEQAFAFVLGTIPWNHFSSLAVDPQDFSARLETQMLLHATAEGNLFQLIIWSQTWFDVLRVQTVCLMGV